jgi:hypothetical protein
VLLGNSTSQANQTPNIGVPGDQSKLVDALQDQIRSLREQLDAEREARTEERRRHDTIVAQLTSRIPAIEAPEETPSEASEAAEAVEQQGRGHSPTPLQEGRRRAHSVGPGGVGCYSGAGDGQRELGVHGPGR